MAKVGSIAGQPVTTGVRSSVMESVRKSPREVAQSLAGRDRAFRKGAGRGQDCARGSGWKRETYTMPRTDARAKAREWFDRFPKAAYMTEIEFWRELNDGQIEFTIRRLPSAD